MIKCGLLSYKSSDIRLRGYNMEALSQIMKSIYGYLWGMAMLVGVAER